MGKLKLFGVSESPFSCRVEIALKLKGLEYEYIEEDVSNKSPFLLQYNPIHKKVPVLVHKGKPIIESLVILEYIDETWPKTNPILPRDPYERAMARFWANFIDKKLVRALMRTCYCKQKCREEEAMREAWEHLRVLENELKGKKFFGGEKMGLVDIVANFIGFWLGAVEEASSVEVLSEKKFPMLCKWRDEYVNYSIVKENLPPKDNVVSYFRGHYGYGLSR